MGISATVVTNQIKHDINGNLAIHDKSHIGIDIKVIYQRHLCLVADGDHTIGAVDHRWKQPLNKVVPKSMHFRKEETGQVVDRNDGGAG